MKKFMFSGAAGCCVSVIASENGDEADLDKASDAVIALWEELNETLPDGAEFSGELVFE